MLNRQQKVILPHLCRLIGSASGGDLSDGDLLERFLGRRDPAAFAVLVRRHGPTVLGVCRRVLRNAHDADDAFQATFLVLARKARLIGRREALGSWLYGVAYRVALRARADAARRRKHEGRAANRTEHQPQSDGAWDDVRPILDEEVSRLPDKYRRPVVLCYFEGKTYQEAARLLGWPAGTASVRLARARELLRGRLALRGLALSSGAMAACMAEATAPASEACLLAEAAAHAAMRWLTDPTAAGLSSQVIALAKGVVNAMLLRKLKTAAGVLLLAGLTLGGAGALYRDGGTAPASAADRLGADAFADAEPPRRADAPLGAPPQALAPAAGEGARPPQTRIGLINMSRVLKGSKKLQARQAELRTATQQAQEKLDALRKHVQQLLTEHDAPTTGPGPREEYARRIKQVQREIEDESERAKARLTKASDDTITKVYREVEDAANRVAKVKGLELVMFYTDAVTEEDFYKPGNLQRKLSQPGALVPMVVAPGMDITDVVIEALNKAYAPADAPRQ
jgi:RNA polymerase sigma factor (sigma-70 family)